MKSAALVDKSLKYSKIIPKIYLFDFMSFLACSDSTIEAYSFTNLRSCPWNYKRLWSFPIFSYRYIRLPSCVAISWSYVHSDFWLLQRWESSHVSWATITHVHLLKIWATFTHDHELFRFQICEPSSLTISSRSQAVRGLLIFFLWKWVTQKIF